MIAPPAARARRRQPERASAKDVKEALDSLNRRGRSRSKYRAEPTTVDGIRFASKKEARRYSELTLLERAGEIVNLEIQPRYALHAMSPLSQRKCVGEYVADFAYSDVRTHTRVVEDVKSEATRTAVYRLKKRIVEIQYGITIREV